MEHAGVFSEKGALAVLTQRVWDRAAQDLVKLRSKVQDQATWGTMPTLDSSLYVPIWGKHHIYLHSDIPYHVWHGFGVEAHQLTMGPHIVTLENFFYSLKLYLASVVQEGQWI